jgi:hypothetical protein
MLTTPHRIQDDEMCRPNLEFMSADMFMQFMATHTMQTVYEWVMREPEVLNTQVI